MMDSMGKRSQSLPLKAKFDNKMPQMKATQTLKQHSHCTQHLKFYLKSTDKKSCDNASGDHGVTKAHSWIWLANTKKKDYKIINFLLTMTKPLVLLMLYGKAAMKIQGVPHNASHSMAWAGLCRAPITGIQIDFRVSAQRAFGCDARFSEPLCGNRVDHRVCDLRFTIGINQVTNHHKGSERGGIKLC
jgi:hypothetical protein